MAPIVDLAGMYILGIPFILRAAVGARVLVPHYRANLC